MHTNKDYTVFVDEDDQCNACEYFIKGVACPLLNALGQGAVYLANDNIVVSGCGFFNKFKRHLKLVKDEVDG